MGASVKTPNPGLWTSLAWRRVDEAFLPALGYLQESGVHKADGEFG